MCEQHTSIGHGGTTVRKESARAALAPHGVRAGLGALGIPEVGKVPVVEAIRTSEPAALPRASAEESPPITTAVASSPKVQPAIPPTSAQASQSLGSDSLEELRRILGEARSQEGQFRDDRSRKVFQRDLITQLHRRFFPGDQLSESDFQGNRKGMLIKSVIDELKRLGITQQDRKPKFLDG